jgi:hypothetical protein
MHGYRHCPNRGSSVSIGYGPDDRDSILGRRWDLFSPRHSIQTDSGAHPAYYSIGTGGGGGSFPVVERPGLEADHSPPSSAEIRLRGAIPPLPEYVFMA